MQLRRVLLLIVLCSARAWAETPTPVGLWQTVSDRTGQADGLVRIVEIDGEFVGTVVAVFSPPAESSNPLCDDCKGDLKGKPIVGMAILHGIRRSANGYSIGEILDPDEGRLYKCRIALLEEGRTLEVRGYIGIPLFGRSQTWTRKE